VFGPIFDNLVGAYTMMEDVLLMIPQKTPRMLLLASAVALSLVTGCTDIEPPPIIKLPYPAQTSPDNVLQKLKLSYVQRDPVAYAEILADDFAFYFDPSTLEENPTLPTFWGRIADSTSTADLFASEEISDIRLSVMEYDKVPEVVNEVGREHWRLIKLTDEKLEVDKKPQPGEDEGTTLLVEGQPHHFYFRKGKTEADTLGSTSSQDWFIVRWEDLGRPDDTQ
jgi:hypothetical protein